MKNQDYWRQKREAASKAQAQAKKLYETRSAYQIEQEMKKEMLHEQMNKKNSLPPQASGAKFQR